MTETAAPEQLHDQNRKQHHWFRQQLKKADILKPEIITPVIEVTVDKSLPALMASREDMSADEAEALQAKVAELRPWNYSIYLGHGIQTASQVALDQLSFRAKLITGAVQQVCDLRGATMIDLACHHGYFGLELASLGASVTGIDLRDINVKRAQLLAQHFRIPNARYEKRNAYEVSGEYDIVYNLGLLYHVTDPYRLIASTYGITRKIAVIDTLTHAAPFSGFIQTIGHDITRHDKGEFTVELHPTYRGLIDLIHAVGFSRVAELRPKPGPDSASHPAYDLFQRRCFIAFK